MKKVPIKNWKKDRSDLAIEVLKLDESNPRIDTGGKISNINVIKELLEEDVLKLAINISEKGFAASSILMVIEKDNKNYITVDGNRRLLAVQMLEKPKDYKKFLSDTNYQKLEKAANKKQETLKNLFSIIYPSRKEADKEMALLHLSGSSIREWKLLRQYRYFKKRITGEKLTLKDFSDQIHIDIKAVKTGLIVYVLYEIAKTNFPDIKNDKGETIYTDNNFLVDKFRKTIVTAPEAERFFKYHFDEDKLKIIFDNKQLFLKRLKSFLQAIYNIQDISNPLAKAAHSKDDRLNFFRSEETSFLSDKEHKRAKLTEEEMKNRGQESMFSDGDKANSVNKDSNKQVNVQETPGTIANKDWIMDKEYKKYNGADKVKYILKEMKLLDPKKNAHVLMPSLRVLLELALYHKLSQGKHIQTIIDQNKCKIQKENTKRIQKGSVIIEPKKNWSPSFREMLIYVSDEDNNILTDPSARKALDKLIKKEGDFITDLNDFIHNVHSISGKDDPEKYWKEFARPFLNIIEDIK